MTTEESHLEDEEPLEKIKYKRKLKLLMNDMKFDINRLVKSIEDLNVSRSEILEMALDIKKNYKRIRIGVKHKIDSLNEQIFIDEESVLS